MPKEKQVDKQWLPTQLSQGHPGINSGFHGNRYKSLVVDPAISLGAPWARALRAPGGNATTGGEHERA